MELHVLELLERCDTVYNYSGGEIYCVEQGEAPPDFVRARAALDAFLLSKGQGDIQVTFGFDKEDDEFHASVWRGMRLFMNNVLKGHSP